MQKALFWAFAAFFLTNTNAQWLNYRAAGTPVTKDGKVDFAAPAPRMADGKPELTGVWHLQATRQTAAPVDNVAVGAPGVNPNSLTANIFLDLKAEGNLETEQGTKVREERTKNGLRLNPTVFCLPMGLPSDNFVAEVVKFIQAPKEIIVIHEVDNSYRQIYLDGRPLPKDPSPSWLGYSTGHWEGDTLVVETEGFNDKTWLDMSGHSHSEAMHLTERYHRRDYGHMDVEMTFNDPVMYKKPFTIKFTHQLVPDSDILEAYCAENEKDSGHILGTAPVK
jgi:hypothetical protein